MSGGVLRKGRHNIEVDMTTPPRNPIACFVRVSERQVPYRFPGLWLLLLYCVLLFLGSSCGDGTNGNGTDPSAGMMRVGFAQKDVTPIVPVKMAGYGAFFISESSCRWSTGVHDPLFAQAAAFHAPDGPASLILIVVDAIGLLADDVAVIQREVASRTGLQEESVVVACTHTHHGPDTIGLWGVLIPPISGRQQEVMDRMLSGAIQAGIEAWNVRVPATLTYAAGLEAGLHENIIFEDPNRTIDDTLTLLAAYDREGGLLGSLMNWACHPTVMGEESTLVTSDFAGAYYRIMAEELGGVHLYINGTLGAMIQPVNRWSPPDAWEEVDAVGRGLAEDVMNLLADARPVRDPSISFLETQNVPVKLENPVFVLAACLGLIDRDMPALGEYANTSMIAFTLGPLTFGTMPGEYVSDYSVVLREIMGGEAQFLIGLGMDWIGYALTPEQHGNSAYAYERSLCAGPDVGEALAEAYRQVWNVADETPVQ